MKKENTLSDQEFLKCQLDPELLDAAEGSKQVITSGYQFGQENTKLLCDTKRDASGKT